MLNPVHLRTLDTVLRCGSFADAARRLGYTSSAVSQQMAALERQVRVSLFVRGAHGIHPTDTAEFIARRSHEALGHLRALEEDIDRLIDGEIGRIRLGSFPTASEHLLPAAIRAFTNARPAVDVRLDEGEQNDLVPLLDARELDVALMYRYGPVPARLPRGVRHERLVVEDLLVLAPAGHPRFEDTPSVSMDVLRDETWITTGPRTEGVAMLHRMCEQADFAPAIAYRSNNYATIHGLVAAGLGLAIVPALGHTPTEGVAAVPLQADKAFREVLALRSPATHEALWETMRQALHASADDLAARTFGVHVPRSSDTEPA